MDGILLVDKPKGWTSFDVVAKIRGQIREQLYKEAFRDSHLDTAQGASEKRTKPYKSTVKGVSQLSNTVLSQKTERVASSASEQAQSVRRPKVKVGHTGTLDPLATGLMVIVIGSYCKRAQEFSKLDKVYEVTMKLGETSTTGDEEGTKSAISNKEPKTNELQEALKKFTGEIMQTPPIFSAIKVNGQRAYDLARKGKEVKLEPRNVTVYSIQLTEYSYPFVNFTTKVSSGTYIRSLVEDIGKELGVGSYMSDLHRTEVGEFKISDAHGVESIDKIINI